MRTGIARSTLQAIEKGEPGVAIGSYFSVMLLLAMGNDLVFLGLENEPARNSYFQTEREKRSFHRRKTAISPDLGHSARETSDDELKVQGTNGEVLDHKGTEQKSTQGDLPDFWGQTSF